MDFKAAKARFDAQGYLRLPGFLPAPAVARHLQAMASFVDLYLQHFGLASRASSSLPPGERLQAGLLRLGNRDPALFAEVCLRLNRLPGPYRLTAKPKLLKLARRLARDPDLAVYQHNLIVSRPAPQWPLDGWHQDAYSGPELHLIANLALTRCNASNGGLRVLPGGHRQGFLPHHIKPGEAHLSKPHQVLAQDPDPRRTLALQLEPGDLVLLHRYLPHAGGVNPGPSLRLVLAARYTSPRLTLARRLVAIG